MEMVSYNIISKNLGNDYKKLCRSNSNYYMPFLTMNLKNKNKSAHIINKLENKNKYVKKEITNLLNIDTIGNSSTFYKLNSKKHFRRFSFINSLKKPSQKISRNPKITIVKEFKFATNNRRKNNNNLSSVQSKFQSHIKKIEKKANGNTRNKNNFIRRVSSALINNTKTQNWKYIIKSSNSDINITNNNNNSFQISPEKQMLNLRSLVLKKKRNLIQNKIKNIYFSDISNIKKNKQSKIITKKWKKKFNKLQKSFENKTINQKRNLHDLFPKPKNLEFVDMRKMKKNNEDNKCEYVWMKKSTVNLISFGDSINKIQEDEFIKTKGEIIKEYPKIQKDAKIFEKNKYQDFCRKSYLEQFENNSRKISDMFYDNKMLIIRMLDKIHKIKNNKSNSALY